MADPKQIRVLLSPKTNELLKIGLRKEYADRMLHDHLKELEKERDAEASKDPAIARYGTLFLDEDGSAKDRMYFAAKKKVDDWLKTGVGQEAMDKHIEDQMQQLNLDHAVLAFKRSNPWYKAVWHNLLASAIGAALGAFFSPIVLHSFLAWLTGQN